jgi:DNA polymerase III gamma/tau subunit
VLAYACVNLQLEEGLQQARLYAAKPQREQAKNLARDSLELLDQIVTYWPDKINNTTVSSTLVPVQRIDYMLFATS